MDEEPRMLNELTTAPRRSTLALSAVTLPVGSKGAVGHPASPGIAALAPCATTRRVLFSRSMAGCKVPASSSQATSAARHMHVRKRMRACHCVLCE
jgi:hypothetical protein